jgi:hypothetical protein
MRTHADRGSMVATVQKKKPSDGGVAAAGIRFDSRRAYIVDPLFDLHAAKVVEFGLLSLELGVQPISQPLQRMNRRQSPPRVRDHGKLSSGSRREKRTRESGPAGTDTVALAGVADDSSAAAEQQPTLCILGSNVSSREAARQRPHRTPRASGVRWTAVDGRSYAS